MSDIPKLNEAGQCPFCLHKPRPYKRKGYFWCGRCGRNYDIDTKQQVPNADWELTPDGFRAVPFEEQKRRFEAREAMERSR